MLCYALLLAACDHGSVDTLRDPSPTAGDNFISLQSPSPASISPFENLTDDTLIAPEQPILSLSAQTGALNFQWQPVDGQIRARLYRHDPLLGGETLTHESNDPTAGNWQLPSQTHARAWHRQQYRVELCTLDDCVSSSRMPLSGLAPYTVDSLSPAVFVEGERYAEQIALNHSATLAVLTLPVEGAMEFQVRIGGQWILTQRLRLNALAISTTRTLNVALSDSGDTVAVLVRDSYDRAAHTIRILERLGEGWVETAEWPVSAAMAAQGQVQPDAQLELNPYTTLTLSSLGDQLLLHSDQILMNYRQTEYEWSEVPYSPNWNDAPESQSLAAPARLMASAQNADFTRLFTLVEENQQLHLSVWTPSGDATSWQRSNHLPIQGLNSNASLAIISNTAGSSVIVAGWEECNLQNRAPVMWRYRVEPSPVETLADPEFTLSVTDSLRAPPTEHANPALIFTADASLTLVALGWHSAKDPRSTSTILPDAALSTYVYDSQTRQWLSALELPQNLPTLAKHSFAADLFLSADGSTMMMTSIAGNTDSSGIRVGEVLVMR